MSSINDVPPIVYEWHTQQEIILKQWSEIGSSYRYLHDRSFIQFNNQNMGFAIPVIIISTVTGTANFAQSSFPASSQPYVPAIIGFFNLLAGLLTTIAQFLRVSELLEGHRASSLAYSKFSRNIAVELSLPINQRSMSGLEFITKCRTELDRLIEQSPNIPEPIVKKFGKRFENHKFIKPDILDIRPVEIYILDEMQEKLKRAGIFAEEERKKDDLIQHEFKKRDDILNEYINKQKLKADEFSELLLQKKLAKKKSRTAYSVAKSVAKSMERLNYALGGNNTDLVDDDNDDNDANDDNDVTNATNDATNDTNEIINHIVDGVNLFINDPPPPPITFNATPLINTDHIDDDSSSSSEDLR